VARVAGDGVPVVHRVEHGELQVRGVRAGLDEPRLLLARDAQAPAGEQSEGVRDVRGRGLLDVRFGRCRLGRRWLRGGHHDLFSRRVQGEGAGAAHRHHHNEGTEQPSSRCS
jgi:hypothetical protein